MHNAHKIYCRVQCLNQAYPILHYSTLNSNLNKIHAVIVFAKKMGVARYVRRRGHVALATACRRLFGTAERKCLLGDLPPNGLFNHRAALKSSEVGRGQRIVVHVYAGIIYN